ncbi:Cutinase transcription factor 1 alpha [Psilocybe cubensis]|uniref:Cutinase transcription factor 1 alpha n=1 Tax=Psilocybe cubensis TaxID=181762 RepID=A0ACB8GFQ9_PSICU|nr:Cutinase transcription factor 1 alpha [Psilocybe cubensis]KAH9474373.1 Cutinase transcription factor 1 alpha [Psilocybe cubensis]
MLAATPPSDSASQLDKPIKKRLPGACEECRRKKSDSAKMPDKICTSCLTAGIECSAVPPQVSGTIQVCSYIRILEARIKRLESYIQAVRTLFITEKSNSNASQLSPDEEVDQILSRPPPSLGKSSFKFKNPVVPDSKFSDSSGKSSGPSSPSAAEDDMDIPEDDDDLAHIALTAHISRLSLSTVQKTRFFGQASPFMIAKHASTIRSKITGVPDTGLDPGGYRRLIFWTMNPWEAKYVNTSEASYIYPEHDLLIHLVNLYFDKTNSLIPLLHAPTFMKSLSAGQHYWDPSFGMTVLMVCAVASRYSDDPRVFSEMDAGAPGLSSGWHFFTQVPVHRRLQLFTTTVYDLQYYFLAALYLQGTSMAPVVCNIVGIGLRYALDMGTHRRRGGNRPTAEEELLKRAFWSLYCFEQINNAYFGRPSCVADDAFDVEYPIECDDEYWDIEDPQAAFRQPAEKPSSITGFIQFIKLCEILGKVSRALYTTTKKSKIQSGSFGHDWEAQTVAELDSAMNQWKDSIPEHLVWDPRRQNDLFFFQSANLHSTFYYVQIQVHRPFMTKKSPMSFSSLAMCTYAARSCASIQEAAMLRGLRVLPNTVFGTFTAAIITVLFLWGSQRPGYVGDPHKDMENLLKCVNVLSECEKRDVLKDAGALKHHQSTMSRSLEGMERQSSDVMPSFAAGDDISSMFVADPNLRIDDWDFYKLLLSQMDPSSGFGVFQNNDTHNEYI